LTIDIDREPDQRLAADLDALTIPAREFILAHLKPPRCLWCSSLSQRYIRRSHTSRLSAKASPARLRKSRRIAVTVSSAIDRSPSGSHGLGPSFHPLKKLRAERVGRAKRVNQRHREKRVKQYVELRAALYTEHIDASPTSGAEQESLPAAERAGIKVLIHERLP